MMARILAWLFFSSSRLRLAPEDLAGALHYDSRRHQAAPPVESEASHAMPMMLYRAAPGQYVGLGKTVIKERRREKRKVLDTSASTTVLSAYETELRISPPEQTPVDGKAPARYRSLR